MAHLNIVNDIRQFATANNHHAFLTDLAGDTPPVLLGRPLYAKSEMDGSVTTGDDDILLVGDFEKYVIADRIGMSIELVPHLFRTDNNRPSGQRGCYCYWRVGAGCVDTDAFRLLRVESPRVPVGNAHSPPGQGVGAAFQIVEEQHPPPVSCV